MRVFRVAQLATLGQQPRTSGSVDGSVDPPATEQGAVRGVDDGIDDLGGDVSLDGLERSYVIGHVRNVVPPADNLPRSQT
jgi:hypothetical protein